MQSKRQRTQACADLSFLRLDGCAAFIPSLQALIFDYLDTDNLTALGIASQTARLFLQHYLAHCSSLAISDNDQHQLLPLALIHCRQLARLKVPLIANSFPDTATRIIRLIRNNARTFAEFVGPLSAPISEPVVLAAFLECRNLQYFHTRTQRSTESLRELIVGVVSQCQQLKSLRFTCEDYDEEFTSEVLLSASRGLTELAASFCFAEELRLAVSRFPSLQTLHLDLISISDFVPVLRELTNLTDLAIRSDPEDVAGLDDDPEVICAFLRSRGYHPTAWGADLDPNPERQMQVLELPRLRKLKLEHGSTNIFIVVSEVLEEATLSVMFDAGVALEMIRHSPVLRKVAVTIEPHQTLLEEYEESVFVDSCRRWSQLTDFQYGSALSDRMLSALATHCLLLESIDASLDTCAVDSILAMLALPLLHSVTLCTSSMKILEQDQQESKEKEEESKGAVQEKEETKGEQVDANAITLPIISSNVRSITVHGMWHQQLVDRLRCPRLRLLNVQGCRSHPELCLDSLLLSAAQSLESLSFFHGCRCHFLDPDQFVSENFDWSGFEKLHTVKLPMGARSSDVAALVRSAPKLSILTAYLRSQVDLARLLSVPNSSLRILNIDHAADVWPVSCLDYILLPLLHPDLRPRSLEVLRVPADSLSPARQAMFPFRRLPETLMGGIAIDVKAFRPGSYFDLIR